MVLGGALAAAAVLAALASVGGLPRLQPLVGLIVILSHGLRDFDQPPRD